MGAARAERLWAIGGTVAAILLLVGGWLFLVSPQQERTAALVSERDATDDRILRLQSKLRDLRQQNAQLPSYQAELERYRLALPTAPALSAFLRDLQTSGEQAQVLVTGFNAGNPVAAPGAGTSIYALSVTVTATGSTANLRAFLQQLQQSQPRAVLIQSANLAPATDEKTLGGEATMTINAEIFIESAATPPASPSPSAAPAAAASPTATPPASGR